MKQDRVAAKTDLGGQAASSKRDEQGRWIRNLRPRLWLSVSAEKADRQDGLVVREFRIGWVNYSNGEIGFKQSCLTLYVVMNHDASLAVPNASLAQADASGHSELVGSRDQHQAGQETHHSLMPSGSIPASLIQRAS